MTLESLVLFIKIFQLIFTSLNRGKESIKLNLKQKKDLGILMQLIKKADVLVENFRPGTMKKLGLEKTNYLKLILNLFMPRVLDLAKQANYLQNLHTI